MLETPTESGQRSLREQVAKCQSHAELSNLVNAINYMRPSGKGRRMMLRDVKASRREIPILLNEVQTEPKPRP